MQQQQPRRHGVPVAESETFLMVKVMMSNSLLHLSYADNGKGNWRIFILYRDAVGATRCVAFCESPTRPCSSSA